MTVSEPGAGGCEAEMAPAERASSLAEQGRLDEALLVLEDKVKACPGVENRLATLRKRIEEQLASLPASTSEAMALGWKRLAQGDAAGAQAAFSKALRLEPSPRALALQRQPLQGAGARDLKAVRFDTSSVLVGASAGDLRGALVVGYARREGTVKTLPMRFAGVRVKVGLPSAAVGPAGQVAIAAPDETVVMGPAARTLRLPGASSAIFADRGATVVLARRDGVRAFDAATGQPRADWQQVPLSDQPELTTDEASSWVARCPSTLSEGEAFVLDTRTGRLLARSGGSACALDVPRRRAVIQQGAPVGGAPRPVSLRVLDLTDGSVVATIQAPTTTGTDALLINEPTGLIRVPKGPGGKPPERWVDPVTGKEGKFVSKRRKGDPLHAIPTGRADPGADVSALEKLTSKPRELVPNRHESMESWTANGVRSHDGRWVAVIDYLKAEVGDSQLILADASTLTVRHRVPLPSLGFNWMMMNFLDHEHLAVSYQDAVVVVHVESGTLRAAIETSVAEDRTPSSLGGGLVSLGDRLVSVADVVDFEQGKKRRIVMPLAGNEIEEKTTPRGLELRSQKPERSWQLLPDGRVEAPQGEAPPWLVCAVGEWLLPFDACAHRLQARSSGG